VRFAGRNKEVAKPPIFTWLFEDRDGGTELTLVVLEEDLSRWQGLLESVSAAVMAKKLNGMLASVKAGVEIPAPSTA